MEFYYDGSNQRPRKKLEKQKESGSLREQMY